MTVVFPEEIIHLADRLKVVCNHRRLLLSVAESCTGGLLGAAITEISGSSSYFLGSAGTYANEAKVRLLSVPWSVIQEDGAVSSRCALAMAQGGLMLYGGNICLSVTGIAGPDGGSSEKPVGTVWFAVAFREGRAHSFVRRFSGERSDVRYAAVCQALETLIRVAGETTR
ncbi:MAG: damage-inducible protein CinA [Dethiosulfovibrio peptidovorans]|nr:MAG: damage-inducible protein CinA [Dethiosulfovibrio peptidovorans]